MSKDLPIKTTLDGTEQGVLRSPGQTPVKWTPKQIITDTVQSLSAQFQGPQGPQGPTGANGKDGAPGKDGATGPAGSPKRVERYPGTVVGSAGLATITFAKPFVAPPLGKVIDGWNGDQQVTGAVSATTTTTATVAVKRSRATLLLSAGPYETAPAGTVVMIEVIGD